jgi:hypothetical protein
MNNVRFNQMVNQQWQNCHDRFDVHFICDERIEDTVHPFKEDKRPTH